MFTNALHQTGEVVLLVDDEDSIRKLVRMILESRGYTVLDASDGAEGLAVCRNHPGRIDLLLSISSCRNSTGARWRRGPWKCALT